MKVKSGYQPKEVRDAIMFKLGKPAAAPVRPARNRVTKPAVLSPSQAKAHSTALAEI